MNADISGATPLLSIVTVCRNSARTIGDTLRSVDLVLQDRSEVEHLIVDGLSTDQTLRVVSEHAHPTRRLISESDTGLYDAMNKGLRHSRGDYVWFVNSDDYLHPRLLSWWPELIAILRERRASILVGEVQMFRDLPGTIVPTRYWRLPKNLEQARQLGWHPPHPAFVANRHLLLGIGGFDESKRIAADFKLMTKAMSEIVGQPTAFPHPLVAMREGGAASGSVVSILRANRECYSSLRELGSSRMKAAANVVAKLLRKIGQKVAPARPIEETVSPSGAPIISRRRG